MERTKKVPKDLYPKNKLKAARHLLGMTQAEMADKIGLTYQTYCTKETGRADVWLSEMVAILSVIKEHDENATLDAIFLRN